MRVNQLWFARVKQLFVFDIFCIIFDDVSTDNASKWFLGSYENPLVNTHILQIMQIMNYQHGMVTGRYGLTEK